MWKVQNHNSKGSGHNTRSGSTSWSRNGNDRSMTVGPNSCRFDIGCFRAEPTNYNWRLPLSDTTLKCHTGGDQKPNNEKNPASFLDIRQHVLVVVNIHHAFWSILTTSKKEQFPRKRSDEEVKWKIHAKVMYSSNSAGVVGNRVVLGTLKRANKIILARNEDYLTMYAVI